MCNCYVMYLGPEAQFCLRFGAHALSCPVYRESGDPVDKRADELIRIVHTAPIGWDKITA